MFIEKPKDQIKLASKKIKKIKTVTISLKFSKQYTGYIPELLQLQNRLVRDVAAKRKWTFSFDNRRFTANLTDEQIQCLRKSKYVEKVIIEPEVHILYGEYAPYPDFNPSTENVDWGVSKLNVSYAWAKGIKGQGVKVCVCDSVPAYSPVIIKDKKGTVDIKPIDEIVKFSSDKYELIPIKGLKIWKDRDNKNTHAWTEIKHIIRHPYKGNLIRINTNSALIDTSPNHSIFSSTGKLINAEKIKIGNKIHVPKLQKHIPEQTFFLGDEQLAWLYGFFAAEGLAYITKANGGHYITLNNKNLKLLRKAKIILSSYFNVKGYFDFSRASECVTLIYQGKGLYNFFKNNFYTNQKDKKVPKEILNAPQNIQLAFLDGYNKGDGYTNHNHHWKFVSFTTTSQILAMGLLYLLANTTKQSYRIDIRDDKPNVIGISINKTEKNYLNRKEVKKIREINYEGFLYDIETEDHSFCTGIGPIKTHNTGIDYNHVDLVDRYKGGYNFVGMNDNPMDDHMHGTYCSGIVGASDNNIGYKGVAPEVDLYHCKVLNFLGGGSIADVAAGVDWARLNGMDIISLSLGAKGTCGGVLKDACDAAWGAGLVVVAAAGNEGEACEDNDCVTTPGNCESAIAVAAIDKDEFVSGFSSKGPQVEVAAPGEGITSCWLVGHDMYGDGKHIVGDKWYWANGSSAACPHVAGAAALIKCWYPDASNYQIREWLKEYAKDL